MNASERPDIPHQVAGPSENRAGDWCQEQGGCSDVGGQVWVDSAGDGNYWSLEYVGCEPAETVDGILNWM